MGKRASVLDGPKMGYGPSNQQRGGVPLSTVILAGVCLVLAALLALSIAGRHQAATSDAGGTPAASPSPTEAPPAGATDAVTTFVAAWSMTPAERDNALASVTQPGVPETVPSATAAALAKAQPTEPATYSRVTSQILRADQPLSDGSTLQLQLVFDQAAIYGWLISSVQAS